MPTIKYLKDAPLGKSGDVAEVLEHEANVLIKLGFAELHQDESTETKPVQTEEISTEGLLTNLNGTPVVSDFGDLVPEQTAAATESQAAKKETKKK